MTSSTDNSDHLLKLQHVMTLSVNKLLDIQGLSSNIRSPVWIACAFLVLAILWFSVRLTFATGRHPYPPGPKGKPTRKISYPWDSNEFEGLPIIGNLLQLNDEPWFIFTEWKKTFGQTLVYSSSCHANG